MTRNEKLESTNFSLKLILFFKVNVNDLRIGCFGPSSSLDGNPKILPMSWVWECVLKGRKKGVGYSINILGNHMTARAREFPWIHYIALL